MPLQYLRDDGMRCIFLTVEGEVSFSDWQAAIERQIAEGCWEYGILYDARHRTNVNSPEDVRQILAEVEARIGEHGPRGPVAYVAGVPEEYVMARMFGELAEHLPYEYAAFDRIDAAVAWLVERLNPLRDS